MRILLDEEGRLGFYDGEPALATLIASLPPKSARDIMERAEMPLAKMPWVTAAQAHKVMGLLYAGVPGIYEV
jgi:hypothetical protein